MEQIVIDRPAAYKSLLGCTSPLKASGSTKYNSSGVYSIALPLLKLKLANTGVVALVPKLRMTFLGMRRL